MIPIRDINPTSTRPLVVYAIAGINVVVWLFEVFLWLTGGIDAMNLFVAEWGLVPVAIVDAKPWALLTPFTSMFIHGGWWHVLSNLWFLWIFGDNVEEAFGKVRFTLFYLLCGLAAALTQFAVDPLSPVPMVGASGAIAGVLAAYVVMHPRAKVITLIPFVVFVELPAYAFIFIWFGLQLLSAYIILGTGFDGGGVAFFAHVGGFVAGLGLALLFRPKKDLVPDDKPSQIDLALRKR